MNISPGKFKSYIFKKSLSISTTLGKIPSLLWVVAYISSIFLFAILFWIFSKGFYHSTSQFENTTKIAIDQFRSELELFLQKETSNVFEHDNSVSVVNVRNLEFSEGYAKFTIDLSVVLSEKVSLHGSVKSKISPDDYHKECDFQGKCSTRLEMSLGETPLNIDNVSNLDVKKYLGLVNIAKSSRQKTLFQGIHHKLSFFKVSEEFYEKLIKLESGVSGFPSDVNGSFWRMLYLSVVTITTLGYGDIVPISDVNRFLVGFESFLGLMIMGLFLNSLARERG